MQHPCSLARLSNSPQSATKFAAALPAWKAQFAQLSSLIDGRACFRTATSDEGKVDVLAGMRKGSARELQLGLIRCNPFTLAQGHCELIEQFRSFCEIV